MSEIVKIAEKNPLVLSKEDIKQIQCKFYSEKKAEQIAEAYLSMKEECPEIFKETIKVDIALATNGEMPPKKWATNPYFPKR